MKCHAHERLNHAVKLDVKRAGTFRPRPAGGCFCGSVIGFIALAFFGFTSGVYSQSADQMPMAEQVLTNIEQIWTVPHDQADEEYRIKTEIIVYFDDREWNNASGECNGNPCWLPIFDSPRLFKAGDRVAIDGVIVPDRERFVWSKTKTRILQENTPLIAETVTNIGENFMNLRDNLVSVEGLIDSELDEATHSTLTVLSSGIMAHAYILKGTNNSPVPFKQGDFVRMKCVYSPSFDRDGKLSSLSLWAGTPEDVQVIGSLDKDPRFNVPATLGREIQLGISPDNLVRVAGVVHKYEAGQWVTIWDGTGQIMIQSEQSQPLHFGDVIEAIGYPYHVGVQACLHNGLYRTPNPTNATVISQAIAARALPLCLAEQVRDLSLEDAARHLPVQIQGIVAWSHTDTPFAYIEDGSGGVKVLNPTWEDPSARAPGTIVTLNGVTDEGAFVPVVTNAVLRRAGWFNIDRGQFVSLEQALTGIEEGNWVEMQGFVRSATKIKGLVRFDLSTSIGEFQAWTPASQPFDWTLGSIIRVDGVCSATANNRHQLTGIQIWMPDMKFLQVEVPAPYDLFAAPLRPLANLRRFNLETALNQRIHTSGTVVRYEAGRCVCLQDGVDSVLALSQQTDPLQPGDKVEVVGFPGEQGQRFVLREAVYRRISSGSEPEALRLSATNSTDSNLDGLLVKAHGILLNKMEKNGETRLLVHAKGFNFEATLDPSASGSRKLQNLQLESQIALKGVYEMQNDEYGRPRSFLLLLRSGEDVQLLAEPPWWTPARLLWGLAGAIVVFLVALIWGLLIARKNKLLSEAQFQLQSANDKLEMRVEERTHQLQAQVKAREQAHIELAQAQRDLMLASRQAGMAEVATGVLHNVGNVLNSVNVSATLLRDHARRSKTNSLVKVANILKEKNGNLAEFLTSDPKGKVMPEFFVHVADELRKEQQYALNELEQLSKNVDHIKDIVAMQQSYAHVAGVVEKVPLQSLVEDALQINSTALVRHGVKVIRQYAEVPEIMVDKHKVLQILINLIRNAKYALEECKEAEKRLTITIARTPEQRLMIRVEDNGVGIPAENLTRIFAHGFTTRSSGHGFGLHIGALNAREMGGSLTASSEGPGRGAVFTLILPLAPPENATVVPRIQSHSPGEPGKDNKQTVLA